MHDGNSFIFYTFMCSGIAMLQQLVLLPQAPGNINWVGDDDTNTSIVSFFPWPENGPYVWDHMRIFGKRLSRRNSTNSSYVVMVPCSNKCL